MCVEHIRICVKQPSEGNDTFGIKLRSYTIIVQRIAEEPSGIIALIAYRCVLWRNVTVGSISQINVNIYIYDMYYCTMKFHYISLWNTKVISLHTRLYGTDSIRLYLCRIYWTNVCVHSSVGAVDYVLLNNIVYDFMTHIYVYSYICCHTYADNCCIWSNTVAKNSTTQFFVRTRQEQGAVSIRKTVLPGMAIPMLKIRRPNGRLIFNMEIAIRR